MSILGNDLDDQLDDAVEKERRYTELVQKILASTDRRVLIVDDSDSGGQLNLLLPGICIIDVTNVDDKDFMQFYLDISNCTDSIILLDNVDKVGVQALNLRQLIRGLLSRKEATPFSDRTIICRCRAIPGYLQAYLPDTKILKINQSKI